MSKAIPGTDICRLKLKVFEGSSPTRKTGENDEDKERQFALPFGVKVGEKSYVYATISLHMQNEQSRQIIIDGVSCLKTSMSWRSFSSNLVQRKTTGMFPRNIDAMCFYQFLAIVFILSIIGHKLQECPPLRPVSTQENKHRIGLDRTGLFPSCIIHTAGSKKLKVL